MIATQIHHCSTADTLINTKYYYHVQESKSVLDL